MFKKTALVVALSAIVLAGCGDDEEARPSNNTPGDEVQDETQDEVQDKTQDETQETGPRDDEGEGVNGESEVTPEEEENEMIGDDEFDMPDTKEQMEEDKDLNK